MYEVKGLFAAVFKFSKIIGTVFKSLRIFKIFVPYFQMSAQSRRFSREKAVVCKVSSYVIGFFRRSHKLRDFDERVITNFGEMCRNFAKQSAKNASFFLYMVIRHQNIRGACAGHRAVTTLLSQPEPRHRAPAVAGAAFLGCGQGESVIVFWQMFAKCCPMLTNVVI